MNSDTIKRFWEKVEKTSGCWLWKASKRNKGYGAFVWADKKGKIIQGRAHRFSFELKNGKIKQGLCVLHKCDTPACVNPCHLFLGTKKENNIDMFKKGRNVSGGVRLRALGLVGKYQRGSEHHQAKITDDIVRSIRQDKQDLSYSKLVTKYRLSIGNLFRIVNKKSWVHVS